MDRFIAHSSLIPGQQHTLKDHLQGVADLASGFAKALGAENEARLAGLLHDLGKYGDLFQERLKGRERHIDHWSMGALAAVLKYRNQATAAGLAVAGHHLGLACLCDDTFRNLMPVNRKPEAPRFSEENLGVLFERFQNDGLRLPAVESFSGEVSGEKILHQPAAAMLDYRLLFSTLVDADYLDTEAHFNRAPDGVKRLRPPGPDLEPSRALDILLSHIHDLAERSTSSPVVNRLRADLLAACLEAGPLPTGQFTLSAPTGSGKTLAMLAFALKHAQEHGQRRVVMVIPYLTIIEQTADVFRRVFDGKLPSSVPMEHFILEHHSMAGLSGGMEAEGGADRAELRRRELTQNWDSPIILTTSVQMLESLFSHRPGACRKLHRLARSVILFDEVQTLPTQLATVTLATLGRLCQRFGSSVVFSTATQPAFQAFGEKTADLGGESWAPREIAPPELGLFRRVKRVRVSWPDEEQKLTPEEVAGELAREENRRSLCVVNLKRQARAVLDALREAGAEGLYHLSTDMCPAHRRAVLEEIRGLLKGTEGPPVRLVSTQCIEAGVDVSFPVVWRAWGPLTAIAQAAGRCNRNGNLDLGHMRVFFFRKDGEGKMVYPDKAYEQAADTAKNVLNNLGAEKMDIDDPEVFRIFYTKLYTISGAAREEKALDLAVRTRHFPETARLYRLIDQDTVNVLVPYDLEAYERLAAQAREEGLTRAWAARATPHAVGVFRPRPDSPLSKALEPIPLLGGRKGAMSEDWFICPAEGVYDKERGLGEPEPWGLLEA